MGEKHLPYENRLKENFYDAYCILENWHVSKLLHVVLPWKCRFDQVQNKWACSLQTYNSKGRTLVAHRKLRYFLITHRLQRLFKSPKTNEHITWHHSHDAVDGVMRHSSNGEVWKHFNRVHPQFSMESRNAYFRSCINGFKLFG